MTKESVLSDLKNGDTGTIIGFKKSEISLTRMLELGISQGVKFRVVKFAPLGDPMEIKIRGFYISIRKESAKYIIVSKGDI